MSDDGVQVIYIFTDFLPVLLIIERSMLESPTINVRFSILALRKNILLFYIYVDLHGLLYNSLALDMLNVKSILLEEGQNRKCFYLFEEREDLLLPSLSIELTPKY